ncbi:SMEK domain-containing protein [Pseudomonadales bacterium]|nr:SMEK domain-containing protein [Pseudomonadales bacterium]
MVVTRKAGMDSIIERLSYIKSQVELSTSQNLTDINIYAENFFRDLLNLVLGHHFQNINIDEKNAAAIDLGDKAAKIAVQVTSTNEFSKIEKTVTKFNEKKLYETYDELKIVIVGNRKAYRKKMVGDSSKHELDVAKDVWDISALVELIGDKSVTEIQEVRGFLEEQVQFISKNHVSKEIATFENLILLLSDEDHPAIGAGFLEEPDPDGKINERFADYAVLLTSEFQDLYIEYGEVLSDVRQHSELGQTKLRRLGIYVKTYSDQVLTDCDGDPKEALKKLVQDLEDLLKNKIKDYDVTAIRFFLIDELLRCNVFPNKEAINA